MKKMMSYIGDNLSGRDIKRRAFRMCVGEILAGYRDITEAKEDLEFMRERNDSHWTARGYEVKANDLAKAIKATERI